MADAWVDPDPSVPPMPPEQARRQLLSPFDFPRGLTDDAARRAGGIAYGYLADVLDRAALESVIDAPIDDSGDAAMLRALGAVAVEAAHCIGWSAAPPPQAVGDITEAQVDSLTVALADAEDEPGETGDGASTREVAASLLADGWTAPEDVAALRARVAALEAQVPRRIESDEELHAVPRSTVVQARDGSIACRYDDTRGVVFGDARPFPWSALRAPAIVLREGREAGRGD